MPDEPVEAVIFDYAGVLGTAPFAATAAFEAALGYPEGSLVRLLFGDYFGPSDPSAVHDWHRLERGEITMAEWLTNVVARAPDHLDGQPFDVEAYGRFLRSSPFGVHWMMVRRARDLRAEGYRTAILTNNVREWGGTWRDSIPIEVFDVVVDSCEVGLRKPEPPIYLLTCEQLDVAPTRAVFLDDNEKNAAAARALGIETVLVGDDPWAALAELDAILDRRA